jgi:3-dehydroquinate dehydratase / shikimate dehydrogenase
MIETLRLILRPWRRSDLPLFAEQNADPVAMQVLSGVLTREESDAYAEREEKHLAVNGFCKWVVEAPGISPFIGVVGLSRVKFEASFTPAIEVAWRLISIDSFGATGMRPKQVRRLLTTDSTVSA